MFILKLHPVDGIWTYVGNIYAESLIHMLQEYVLHVNEPNPVLGTCNKNLEVFKASSQMFWNWESSLNDDHLLSG